MGAQAVLTAIGSYGLVASIFIIILSAWGVIAVRDSGSWARKLFEAAPKAIVLGVEYVASFFVKRQKQVATPNSSERFEKFEDFDSEFWKDDFTLRPTQVKKYSKIASAMPPT
ncbi:MAG TPA: hypothetical protein VK825_02305 [Xanthobacteraceae bacterium]|nr:hypothetical protein [Xanthobacteraceae bacterium]